MQTTCLYMSRYVQRTLSRGVGSARASASPCPSRMYNPLSLVQLRITLGSGISVKLPSLAVALGVVVISSTSPGQGSTPLNEPSDATRSGLICIIPPSTEFISRHIRSTKQGVCAFQIVIIHGETCFNSADAKCRLKMISFLPGTHVPMTQAKIARYRFKRDSRFLARVFCGRSSASPSPPRWTPGQLRCRCPQERDQRLLR